MTNTSPADMQFSGVVFADPVSAKEYVASEDANYWRYEAAPRGKDVSLLTIGGKQTTGIWYGEYGQYFIAWAPFIKRNKPLEEQLRKGGKIK